MSWLDLDAPFCRRCIKHIGRTEEVWSPKGKRHALRDYETTMCGQDTTRDGWLFRI